MVERFKGDVGLCAFYCFCICAVKVGLDGFTYGCAGRAASARLLAMQFVVVREKRNKLWIQAKIANVCGLREAVTDSKNSFIFASENNGTCCVFSNG